MALVGPRPERPEFATKIEQHVPEFSQRLCLRPGITGLAQVHQGPDTDMNSVRRKLIYDLEYARCGSMWLDWRIMVCTLLRATKITRSWGVRLLKVPVPCTQHVRETAPNSSSNESMDPSVKVAPAQISLAVPRANDVESNGQSAEHKGETGSADLAHASNGRAHDGAAANGTESAVNNREDRQDDAFRPPHSVAPVR